MHEIGPGHSHILTLALNYLQRKQTIFPSALTNTPSHLMQVGPGVASSPPYLYPMIIQSEGGRAKIMNGPAWHSESGSNPIRYDTGTCPYHSRTQRTCGTHAGQRMTFRARYIGGGGGTRR